ncbi:hypothetical protein Syun_027731 [Stephania yunnanensis]|uniref:Uncharacterized protein n=1 Tax=Stephania yunnanensis TaxID=152371 RepID=A0AAP0HRI6_9MAGN
MVQEEQNQRCSTSSSGGCGGVNGGRCAKSSKKIKQTKIPQRGLGVEKLEKIRLEEQRRNETTTMPVVLPLNDHPCRRHDLHQQQQQQQNSSSMSVSHLDLFSPPIPLPRTNSSAHYLPSNVINTTFGNASSESIFAWPGHVMADGYGCVPSTWNASSESIFACPGHVMADGYCCVPSTWNAQELTNEFTIWVNSMNSRKDLKPNWPCPTSVPRKQQHQQVSTLMNVCATSISSSSGLNLQMEPPSNQSCYSNYYSPPIWPEEEKMVGMKRPRPFSLDNPTGPSYKFHQIIPNLFKPGESSSLEHKNIGTLSCFDSLREAHNLSRPCSFKWSTKMLEMNQGKIVVERGPLDGNSLSLGLSTTASSLTSSKSKQLLSFPPTNCPQLNGFTYQVGIEDPLTNHGSSVRDRRLYSFFPLKTLQIGHGISNERSDEAENDMDLTLKL